MPTRSVLDPARCAAAFGAIAATNPAVADAVTTIEIDVVFTAKGRTLYAAADGPADAHIDGDIDSRNDLDALIDAGAISDTGQVSAAILDGVAETFLAELTEDDHTALVAAAGALAGDGRSTWVLEVRRDQAHLAYLGT